MYLHTRAAAASITDPFGDYACPALCSAAPPVDPPSIRCGTPPPPPAHG
ncbi:MAG: hypothetical protein AAAB13_03800 [Pseudomonas sp.]